MGNNSNNKGISQQIDYLRQFVSQHKQKRIAEVLENRTRHLSIVLEDIYQPHNISAVIRSCDCFGVQDVHVIENKNKFVVNDDIALGSSKWITVQRYQGQAHNTKDCLFALKKQGYQIAALSLQDPCIELSELDLSQKTAICIGTEETGLSSQAHEMADVFVRIPMVGFTQSFNLSVTSALCMYELQQRLPSNTALSDQEKQALTLEWFLKIIAHSDKILARYLK